MPDHPCGSEAVGHEALSACIAEFVGTLVLVLAITGYVSASSRALEIFLLAIVHGLALMGIVNTIGSILGADVNPAVTLALLAIKKIDPREVGLYIVLQLLGGIAGALLAKMFFLGAARSSATARRRQRPLPAGREHRLWPSSRRRSARSS